jgi:peptide chain release factor subunit 3
VESKIALSLLAALEKATEALSISEKPAETPVADDDGDAAAAMDGDDEVFGGEEGEEGGKKAAVDDTREHLNVVFIGHVDAGKSTLSGSILYHTGQVDARAIEKYERDAKAKGRDSWWLAFILDTTDEERTKGITVEVGRATFETTNKRFTILDAPGHKNYVPNMIAGAAQADVAVLVISARKGEFETGFERGGQTREHAMLAKTLGVRVLIVVVNKMDEPTVKWDKGRWDEIVGKLTPFLKQSGYNTAKHVHFIPISGLSGANIKDRTTKEVCPWYDGPSLLECLDGISVGGRDPEAPLRIPVLDKYNDRGIIVMGKVESGTVREGQKIALMPLKVEATVDTLYINDAEVKQARPGENVKLKLKGCREEDVLRGYVLCDVERPIIPVKQFEAQLMLLELEAHSLFTAGYSAVLHVHTAQEEITVKKLVAEVDKKTGEPKAGAAPPRFMKSGGLCIAVLEAAQNLCVEKFEHMQQMGRFTLRDGQRTIAIGKILRLGIPKSQSEAYKKMFPDPPAAAGGAGAAK